VKTVIQQIVLNRLLPKFFATLVFFISVWALGAAPVSALDETKIKIITQQDIEYEFDVELALTPSEQARGLMFRTDLGPDKGMLFIFPEPKRASFWMRNTLIPLDMLFVRQNGRIANIREQVQPETDTPRRSVGRVKAVLELAGGRAAELGIKAGDMVVLPDVAVQEPVAKP
jgi:uncharacterized membrane protein (UPF0127 family)